MNAFVSGCALCTAILIICMNILLDKKISFSIQNLLIYFLIGISCIVFPWYLSENADSALNSSISVGGTIFYYMVSGLMCFSIKIGSIVKNNRLNKENFFAKCVDGTNKNINIQKFFLKIAWIMLFVGMLSLFLYTKAYGGYVNYVAKYALYIRIGIFSINNPWSFLQPFCEFPMISMLVFLCFLNEKTMKIKRINIVIGFLLSAFFSFLILYANKARLALLIFGAVILLSIIDIYVKSRKVNFLLKLGILLLSSSLVVVVSSFLARGSAITIRETIFESVDFVYENFYFWYENFSFDKCRWMFDVFIMPIYILPSSIWSGIFGIKTISEMNTYWQAGGFKGTSGVTGETPMDFLSFAFSQGGIITVILIGIIVGFILKKLDIFLKNNERNNVKFVIKNYIVFEVLFRSVLNSDTEAIVVRLFPAICFIMLIYLFKKVKTSRNKDIICADID